MAWEPTPIDDIDTESLIVRLSAVVDHRSTPELLDRYFDPGGDFAGAWFHRLDPYAHGPFDIGCHDLLAVTFLDVRIPSFTSRQLISDRDTRLKASRLLADVPTEIDLWDANDDALRAANRLWNAIDDLAPSQLGDGKLSKLLARKRPRLILITDKVVREYLVERDLWSRLRACLARGDNLLAKLQDLGARDEGASLLRVLDAAIWMHRSRQPAASQARLDAGIAEGGILPDPLTVR